MKQLIRTTILLLALLLPATAAAYDFEMDGIYYSIYGNTAIVTYKGPNINNTNNDYSGSVVIPATVTHNGTTYQVTTIGVYAFYRCTGLTSVVIPNSVTAIGDRAFESCYRLTSANIPNSVTSIGAEAFHGCTGLTSIDIPNSVTAIGNSAFENCSGLTSIDIPNSVTNIGAKVFKKCTGLTNIGIPNSVKAIGIEAFWGCSGLTSIDIPNSVTAIGNQAFYLCYGLTSIVVESGNPRYDSRDNCNALIETANNKLIVGCNNTTIPNSVTEIGEYALAWCSGLTNIVIPNSVTAIGEGTFRGCTGLTSIVIPNSVTTIGYQAFLDCTGLTSIDISNSVTEIGYGAFFGCSGLTSIVVESSNKRYDSRNNCNAIIETANNKLIFGSNKAIIPNSVTAIGGYAFAEFTGLTSIIIPNSVTSFGPYAFAYCPGLKDVYCYIADLSRVSTFYFEPSFYLEDDDYSGRTLHVLKGMANTYKTDVNWFPYFSRIVDDLKPGILPYDVNGDGEINIADVNALIDIILGGNDSTSLADVNGDGEINLADVNSLIDHIQN